MHFFGPDRCCRPQPLFAEVDLPLGNQEASELHIEAVKCYHSTKQILG